MENVTERNKKKEFKEQDIFLAIFCMACFFLALWIKDLMRFMSLNAIKR